MPSWAGGWDNVFAQPYTLLNEPSAAARGVARIMFPVAQRDVGAVMKALDGVAPGANATWNNAQVAPRQADGMNMGGQVPIANQVVINRATTAADVVALNNILQPTFAPAIYPNDRSGNGGGGKFTTINMVAVTMIEPASQTKIDKDLVVTPLVNKRETEQDSGSTTLVEDDDQSARRRR